MAMNPDRWTLEAIRVNVLGMLGFPTSGSLAIRALPIVNACIAQAHKMVYEESSWYPLALRVFESLSDGVTEYEWPESVDPGRVYTVGVRSTAAAGTPYVYPMRPGLREVERNAGISPAALPATQPMFYCVENGMVTISPAPNVLFWDALVVEGIAAYAELVNTADLSCVDGQMVAQRAEILARPRLGKPTDGVLLAAHKEYGAHIKAKNADGRSFMMNDAENAATHAYPGLENGFTSWRPPSSVVGP